MTRLAKAARFLAGLAALLAAGDLAVGGNWLYAVAEGGAALWLFAVAAWIDHTTTQHDTNHESETP
jgi:hypothetical protein